MNKCVEIESPRRPDWFALTMALVMGFATGVLVMDVAFERNMGKMCASFQRAK